MISPSVIFENELLLCLNKPSGWVINDSKTSHGNPTVQEFIKSNFNFELSSKNKLRNGIVHRLDKDTSGVLLVAKKEDAFYSLQKQFKDRLISKTYTTLVHGELKGGGKISGPISRNPTNRTHFWVSKEGRDAYTEYMCVKGYVRGGEKYTLLNVFPKTGRTHQIRVHLSHIKHPVVSDPLYLGLNAIRRDTEWCPRLFLHASELVFLDPKTNEKIKVEAPLPDDLAQALNLLS